MFATVAAVIVTTSACAIGSTTAASHDTTAASSVTSPSDHGADTEVSFIADGLTIYGSLRMPTRHTSGSIPAALILAGSGPTDRNGNSAITGAPRPDNLRQIADLLATRGIASLRYDKFGSGLTRFGNETEQQVTRRGFSVVVDEAVAGTQFLTHHPGINPGKIALVGHSEGALVALAAVHSGHIATPAGLALLEPAPLPLLDILTIQLRANFAAAAQKLQITHAQAAALNSALARAIASIRATGTVPADLPPTLKEVGLTAINANSLRDEDLLDPRTLIATLPAGTPVLTTHSDADTQVTSSEVETLNTAAHTINLDSVHLTSAQHSLQTLGTTTLSPQFITAFTAWTQTTLHPKT